MTPGFPGCTNGASTVQSPMVAASAVPTPPVSPLFCVLKRGRDRLRRCAASTLAERCETRCPLFRRPVLPGRVRRHSPLSSGVCATDSTRGLCATASEGGSVLGRCGQESPPPARPAQSRPSRHRRRGGVVVLLRTPAAAAVRSTGACLLDAAAGVAGRLQEAVRSRPRRSAAASDRGRRGPRGRLQEDRVVPLSLVSSTSTHSTSSGMSNGR